ncbi:MAG: 30S ribosomal protein S3 [Desulfurococcaceae archaeon]|jgi:small subunit ribosomal protein S3|nr:30S ribosomal protein S3 [Desulfurococcaceae archaeon]
MVDIKKYFIEMNLTKLKIDEYLAKTLYKAGYAGVDLFRTPLGDRVIIYADRPAMVIGRRGQQIKRLADILSKYFKLENPQITVTGLEVPELSARVMASRIALALEKGYHFRRAAYVALRRILAAGAIGCEIVISGKLTSERARYEKIRAGKVYKTGGHVERLVDRAVVSALLKPGLYGVEVVIVRPGTPDDYVALKEPAEGATQGEPSTTTGGAS